MAGNIAEVILRVKADPSQVPQVTRALQDVGQEAEQAAAALEGLEDGAGKVGQSSAKLAGALDLVAPGMGQVALAVADFADVGEVAAGVASALGVSMGTLAAVAAPIAIVVAGIALAWSSYSASAKEAQEAQDRLNAALDGVDPIARRATDEIDKLKLNLGQLTQAQYDDNEIRKDFADQLDTGTAKLREERDALKAHMAEIGTANDEYLTLQDRLHVVNGLIETATTLNQQGRDAALANADIARERAESEKVLAERLKAKAEAERRAASATKDHTTVLKAQAEVAPNNYMMEAYADERLKFWSDVGQAAEEAGARREAAFLNDVEQTQAWAEAQVEAFDRVKQAQADYQNAMAGSIGNATSIASSVGGALAGGSLAGVIGAIGPALGQAIAGPIGEAVGGAIGAWFGFLEQIGSKSVDEIKASMSTSMDNILKGVYALPELIGEVFKSGGFFVAYEKAISLAFLRAVVNLWQAIIMPVQRAVAAIQDFFQNPAGRRTSDERQQDRQDRREQRRENVVGLLKYLWSGEFATGTDYVPRTGLALVHQGERIVPSHGAGSGRTSMMGGGAGGDIHVHFPPGLIMGSADQIVRELNKALGASNRRLSWAT